MQRNLFKVKRSPLPLKKRLYLPAAPTTTHPENLIPHVERGNIHPGARDIPLLREITLQGVRGAVATHQDGKVILHKAVTHQDAKGPLLNKAATLQDGRVTLRKAATPQDVREPPHKAVILQDARGLPLNRVVTLQGVRVTLHKEATPQDVREPPLIPHADLQERALLQEEVVLLMHQDLLDPLCLGKQVDFVLLPMNPKEKEDLQGLLNQGHVNFPIRSSANTPPQKR